MASFIAAASEVGNYAADCFDLRDFQLRMNRQAQDLLRH
jgi:hypothetical protein